MSRALVLVALATGGCAAGAAAHLDADAHARDAGALDDAPAVEPRMDAGVVADALPMDAGSAADGGPPAMPLDGACWMTSPAAACADGVCDPGCESALECPVDCPAPMGGIPCSGGPTTWACSANRSARYECLHGHYAIESCGGPGSCVASPGSWPAQCHGCNPCDAPYGGLGTPFLWSCNVAHTARRRCIDWSSGGDCHIGVSTTCCALDDDCVGSSCVTHPEGIDDTCS